MIFINKHNFLNFLIICIHYYVKVFLTFFCSIHLFCFVFVFTDVVDIIPFILLIHPPSVSALNTDIDQVEFFICDMVKCDHLFAWTLKILISALVDLPLGEGGVIHDIWIDHQSLCFGLQICLVHTEIMGCSLCDYFWKVTNFTLVDQEPLPVFVVVLFGV